MIYKIIGATIGIGLNICMLMFIPGVWVIVMACAAIYWAYRAAHWIWRGMTNIPHDEDARRRALGY